MSKTIEHAGIINEIRDGYAEVKIIQNSACSACHAKGACTAADKSEKIVSVKVENGNLRAGDTVMIEGATSMGFKAVFYAFVIPFILIMSLLIIIYICTENELYSALGSLSSLIPYYLILHQFNDKMKNKFIFTLRKV